METSLPINHGTPWECERILKVEAQSDKDTGVNVYPVESHIEANLYHESWLATKIISRRKTKVTYLEVYHNSGKITRLVAANVISVESEPVE